MLSLRYARAGAGVLSRGAAASFHSGTVNHASEGSVLMADDGTPRMKKQVHHASVPFPSFLKTPKTVAIIGAPMIYGQPRPGTDFGPAQLREAGMAKELKALNWEVEDHGDIDIKPPHEDDPAMDQGRGTMRFGYCVGQACKQVFDKVYTAASEGKFALTLGGDHSIGAGTVAGILKARPNTGVIWVDAHADINTPGDSGLMELPVDVFPRQDSGRATRCWVSDSGNIHGMPVAFLARLIDPTLVPGWEWMVDTPKLHPSQIVYIGLRDVDEAERMILKELGITCFTMQHVDRYGIGGVMERTLDQLHGRPLHCSYDVDAVDPLHAPSTGTAVRGGLTFREANYVVEALSETGHLGSLDMVEVNPSLGSKTDNAVTVNMALALIDSALGSRII